MMDPNSDPNKIAVNMLKGMMQGLGLDLPSIESFYEDFANRVVENYDGEIDKKKLVDAMTKSGLPVNGIESIFGTKKKP